MEYETFNEFQARIQALYSNQEYHAALELATQYTEFFPDDAALMYYWRSTMAARIGDYPQSIALLHEILDTDFWYGEVLLRKSPSFQPLQGMQAFEEVVELNLVLRQRDQETIYPLLTMRPEGQCLSGGEGCPLLIGLHANASTARASFNFWAPAARAGWLVAVPQSTQAMWKGAYVWDDRQIAEAEVTKDFQAALRQYSIDQERVILAGHSMGAEIAIWLALTGKLPARGFIAFGPGGPFMDELENWQPVLESVESTRLRGYIIFGEEDNTIPQENVRTFANLLNDCGIECGLEEVPGVEHDHVPEFNDSLMRGLNFILEDE